MIFHNLCNTLFSIRIKRNCFLWKSSIIINFLCGPKVNRFVKCCTKDNPRIEPPLCECVCVCTVSFFTTTTYFLIHFSWEWLRVYIIMVTLHETALAIMTYICINKHTNIYPELEQCWNIYRFSDDTDIMSRTPKTSGWPLVQTCIVFLL